MRPTLLRSCLAQGIRGARPGLLGGARGVPLSKRPLSTSSRTTLGNLRTLMTGAAVTAGMVFGLGMWTKDEDIVPTMSLTSGEKGESKVQLFTKASADDGQDEENQPPRSAYSVEIGKNMPEVVQAFVEVSRGSRNKYEWDEKLGHIVLDRVLHSAVFYPHNYGFVPQTLCGDGDPLDVLIMGADPLEPGCFVDVRPIGYLVMQDEKGTDEKLLGVAAKDPRLYEVRTLRNVPEHVLREITQFFETYKTLEKNKWVKVGGWKGATDAKLLVEATHRTYKEIKQADGEVFDYSNKD
uniref:Inorganic pyrophosphatase n=1 Tax=Lotharella oceanica TaxID=641309 RepID=A0A7S2TVC7_9EUKA|mmetsp:Transcript_31269/g.58298  ORF Transcript_31269/g.58298 Transcript_31269/m.58298 type:complete len:295 (+) Transcript_31269:37-921(+)|eukprot:CAMPEP_0170168084 /NCGR_PEP_ID=MMETSP0040_2-20121228/1258_1 /TAXON_ID=641309 /ORGANISM="Lotharella oceanica, Strain CCMP622" /LENGTH=294 /DNA_ID=CAMNT_0010406263 /DNA_START=24 /DNA_END=908 /DNA_ORIENTATION=+